MDIKGVDNLISSFLYLDEVEILVKIDSDYKKRYRQIIRKREFDKTLIDNYFDGKKTSWEKIRKEFQVNGKDIVRYLRYKFKDVNEHIFLFNSANRILKIIKFFKSRNITLQKDMNDICTHLYNESIKYFKYQKTNNQPNHFFKVDVRIKIDELQKIYNF
jgi:hypothetical protein